MCLWLHQYIYSRVPENVPKHWDTVICPVNKLLGSSLACTQPVRDCQLEISQRTRRHGWGIRNFQRHTLFHRIPFACSCPFLKVYRHYQYRLHTVCQVPSMARNISEHSQFASLDLHENLGELRSVCPTSYMLCKTWFQEEEGIKPLKKISPFPTQISKFVQTTVTSAQASTCPTPENLGKLV